MTIQQMRCLLLAVVVSTSLQAKKDKDSVLDSINQRVAYIAKKVTSIDEMQKCSTVIMQSDVGTSGYVITEPGDYCLGEDIVFNPATPAAGQVAAAITISCSNVNLMLNNYCLSQAGVDGSGNVSSTQTPFVVGILVPDLLPIDTNVNDVALESIYISGDQAIIDGFSMYGIRVFGHTADVRISNITVKNCGKLASFASRTENPALANYVANSIGNGFVLSFGVGGIALGESNYLGMGPQFFTQNSGQQNRISSVVLENVVCFNNFLNGLNMANATDVYITGCHFDSTYSDDPNGYVSGAEFGGADLASEFPSLLNLVIKQSTVNNTALQGDFMTSQGVSPIYGFVTSPIGCDINQSQNIVCENCHFDNSSNSFIHSNATGMVGLYSDGTIDVSILNCTIDGTTDIIAPAAVYFGLLFPCSDLKISDCTANNTQQLGLNQLPAPLLQSRAGASGFNVAEVINLTMENCSVCDTICNGPVDDASFVQAYDIFAGFGEVSSNSVVKGCLAARTVAMNGGQVQGFNVFVLEGGSPTTLQTILMEDCIAEGNLALVPTFTINPLTLVPYGNVQSSADGFFFQDLSPVGPTTSFPTSYINCKALHNKGISFDAPNGYYSAGFYTNTATRQVYYNCEAIDNVYGFLLQNTTSCIVRNCRSDLNVAADGLTGAGFTDLGAAGTPASPDQSFSLFESNMAFENAAGTQHFGTLANSGNANYNVKYGSSLDNVPTLTGNLTHPNALGGSYFPEANYIAHNLSITLS